MKCDKEWKGFDISIYEMEGGYYVSEVKAKNGQRLYGWQLVPSFNCAMMKAVKFIDSMISRGVKP